MRRLVLFALVAAGCTPEIAEAPPEQAPPENTGYEGVLAGVGNETGRLVVTIEGDPAAGDARASARASIGGRGVLLTGSWSSSTQRVQVDNGTYAFEGSPDATGGLAGRYVGPNGQGAFAVRPDDEALQLLCGTFAGISNGVWNVAVSADGSTSGVFAGTFDAVGISYGSVDGTTYTAAIDGGGTAEGTLSGGRIDGTWDFQALQGTFTGTVAACPPPP